MSGAGSETPEAGPTGLGTSRAAPHLLNTVGDHLTPGPTCRLIPLTNFQNDQTSTAHNSTNMTLIKAALEAIELLEPGELINYTFFANKYGYEEQRILTNQQDKELIKYINKLTERGLFALHEMLWNFAKELTGKKPGKHWPRKQANSAYKYTLYFKLLSQKLQEYKLRPEDIYNMDEKGFMIGMLVKGLRIFSKQKYQNSGLKQRLQDGNREPSAVTYRIPGFKILILSYMVASLPPH
ncbi:hypothetical protein GB937_010021 [Aspergillus fischeri]|nr:hypothetical protein GB937_010021 [Aspergillus fischeri]